MGDHRSIGLQRNSEVINSQKTWENRPKRCFTQQNSRQMSRESSVDSYTSEQNRDNTLFTTVRFGSQWGSNRPLRLSANRITHYAITLTAHPSKTSSHSQRAHRSHLQNNGLDKTELAVITKVFIN